MAWIVAIVVGASIVYILDVWLRKNEEDVHPDDQF